MNDFSTAALQQLGRGARRLDLSRVKDTVAGASALVTGGGGSIGAALARALSAHSARTITALDSSEHALANLMSVSTDLDRPKLQEVIADVRDRARLARVLERSAPDIVFHAAALKHIHLGDRHPTECILTNLVGVKNTLDAAEANGAPLLVFISSDKAAAPTSVMGACKRLAELFLQGRNAQLRPTRALTVRFGNVLGSQGSVVEVFERQISAGGPVTLTHRDMQRYFMTIEEAVGLILLATAEGAKSQEAANFLLDMGAPVKILHLAERMIKASGREIAIVETGPREGEKFDEELYDAYESLHPAGVDGLLAIRSHAARHVTDADVDRLEAIAHRGDENRARAAVFELLHACLGGSPATAAATAAAATAHTASRQTPSRPYLSAGVEEQT